jgi:hypothetical protein
MSGVVVVTAARLLLQNIGDRTLDLRALFLLVVRRGGFDAVTAEDSWAEVYRELDEPLSVLQPAKHACTSPVRSKPKAASAHLIMWLPRHYRKWLLEYERFLFPHMHVSTAADAGDVASPGGDGDGKMTTRGDSDHAHAAGAATTAPSTAPSPATGSAAAAGSAPAAAAAAVKAEPCAAQHSDGDPAATPQATADAPTPQTGAPEAAADASVKRRRRRWDADVIAQGADTVETSEKSRRVRKPTRPWVEECETFSHTAVDGSGAVRTDDAYVEGDPLPVIKRTGPPAIVIGTKFFKYFEDGQYERGEV